MDGGVAGAHLLQRLFGGDAAVHDPDSVGTAILCFDLFEKIFQGGLVTGVARHHLVGEREALRGHDQGDDHLDAIRAFVSAVAKLTFPGKRRVALEVGTGQVIEQHIEARLEQHLPALAKKREEGAFVGQQLVQASVQGVIGQHANRTPQQVAHGAMCIPVAMQTPFTAGVDELIAHLCLQDLEPLRALPTRGQSVMPKSVELQLLPQRERQPTRAPLTRMMES